MILYKVDGNMYMTEMLRNISLLFLPSQIINSIQFLLQHHTSRPLKIYIDNMMHHFGDTDLRGFSGLEKTSLVYTQKA